MRNREAWFKTIKVMCEGTDFEPFLVEAGGSNAGVAIVSRTSVTPQYVAVYPKKTKNPGIFIRNEVVEKLNLNSVLTPNNYIGKGARYNDICDEDVIKIFELFLKRKWLKEELSIGRKDK